MANIRFCSSNLTSEPCALLWRWLAMVGLIQLAAVALVAVVSSTGLGNPCSAPGCVDAYGWTQVHDSDAGTQGTDLPRFRPDTSSRVDDSGRWFTYGGYNAAQSIHWFWYFDLNTWTWHQADTSTVLARGKWAVNLEWDAARGRIWMMAGYTNPPCVEYYDVALNAWTLTHRGLQGTGPGKVILVFQFSCHLIQLLYVEIVYPSHCAENSNDQSRQHQRYQSLHEFILPCRQWQVLQTRLHFSLRLLQQTLVDRWLR